MVLVAPERDCSIISAEAKPVSENVSGVPTYVLIVASVSGRRNEIASPLIGTAESLQALELSERYAQYFLIEYAAGNVVSVRSVSVVGSYLLFALVSLNVLYDVPATEAVVPENRTPYPTLKSPAYPREETPYCCACRNCKPISNAVFPKKIVLLKSPLLKSTTDMITPKMASETSISRSVNARMVGSLFIV